MLIYCICILYFVTTAKANCGVISKAEWNGVEAIYEDALHRPVDLVIIQHSHTRPCFDDEECAELIRAIQLNEMENLREWDVTANFLVGGNGKIYEGTGWMYSAGLIQGYSNRAIEITFLGNFNTDTPTTQSLEAVKELLRCGVDNGYLSSYYNVVGQRQLVAVESPGKNLFNEIKKWPEWIENARTLKKTI